MLIQAEDSQWVNVEVLKLGTRTISASKYGKTNANGIKIDFNEEEKRAIEKIREIWKGILNRDVEDELDFFAAGECLSWILKQFFQLRFEST